MESDKQDAAKIPFLECIYRSDLWCESVRLDRQRLSCHLFFIFNDTAGASLVQLGEDHEEIALDFDVGIGYVYGLLDLPVFHTILMTQHTCLHAHIKRTLPIGYNDARLKRKSINPGYFHPLFAPDKCQCSLLLLRFHFVSPAK